MFKILNNYRKLKPLGIPLLDWIRWNSLNCNSFYQSNLLSKNFLFTNPYWYFHSVKEIFVDNVYKFNSNVDKPYIIDCGANWGLSVIYFKQIFPNSQILAFEPDEEIFKLLKNNVLNFSLKDVELLNVAVWSVNTELEFSSDGSLGGSVSKLKINKSPIIKRKVEAISLKPFLEGKIVDFLKLDIEGSEFEVLKSIKDDLSDVKNIFIEYHSFPDSDQLLPEILSILKAAGFRFYIKEAYNNMKFPFLNHNKDFFYDLQLNIFAFKK